MQEDVTEICRDLGACHGPPAARKVQSGVGDGSCLADCDHHPGAGWSCDGLQRECRGGGKTIDFTTPGTI